MTTTMGLQAASRRMDKGKSARPVGFSVEQSAERQCWLVVSDPKTRFILFFVPLSSSYCPLSFVRHMEIRITYTGNDVDLFQTGCRQLGEAPALSVWRAEERGKWETRYKAAGRKTTEPESGDSRGKRRRKKNKKKQALASACPVSTEFISSAGGGGYYLYISTFVSVHIFQEKQALVWNEMDRFQKSRTPCRATSDGRLLFKGFIDVKNQPAISSHRRGGAASYRSSNCCSCSQTPFSAGR